MTPRARTATTAATKSMTGGRQRRQRILPLAALALAITARGWCAEGNIRAEADRVDQAVERGLDFLLRGQLSSGTFNSSEAGRFAAIPALCGMAFLARGHVPGDGARGAAVERIVDHLLDKAREDGYMGVSGGKMYSHCIATLFLSEVSGMLDPGRQARIAELLPKAVQIILNAQARPKPPPHQGGWRYEPHSDDSDMSCSGWALMALRSSRLNGAPVPRRAIEDAVGYVLRYHDERTGTFGYQNLGQYAETLTGAGLLCLELCGRHGHPATLRAARYLERNYRQLEKVQRKCYGLYYAAQGLFQIGGDPWKTFAEWMYDYWIPRQAPDGSWRVPGEDACVYYQTAMMVLAFTVPYRQLPIYQRDETVDEAE